MISATVETQQQPAVPVEGVSSADVTAVLVDVVVRDRQGNPVRDLEPSDFEVLEDGVPQTIASFAPIFEDPLPEPPSSPESAPSATTAVASPKPSDPRVVALVFDRLTPDARRIAVQAAKEYLRAGSDAPHYVGVFGIDLSLRPYAPFTRDVETLGAALDAVERRGSISFDMDSQEMGRARQAAATSTSLAESAIAGAGGGSTPGIGSAPGAAELDQMQQRILTGFEAIQRDQAGYTFTNSLFALIDALRGMPGRKSIVLFSEGVAIPPNVQRLFLGVIDAANRANVSIYTMDAAGLRTESEQAKIRDQVNMAGAAGLERRSLPSGAVSAPLTRELEKNEDVLRQDPHAGLGELAQGTGGLLFENTNNLRRGLEQIDSDLRNYYLLGYTPVNDTYDGTFRNIDVRVRRSGVTVAARNGYFAVRDTGGAPVNTWEAPALGLVERRPVPNAFPVRAAALSFPAAGGPGSVPVLVYLQTAPMTFVASPDQGTFTSDFAIVVRFLGPDDEVVRKVGQHYELSGSMDELERARNSEVIFYREPDLPPGLYTMETIVYDGPSGDGSVRYATVEVPRADPATLRLSSLLVVKRAERVDPDEPREGPLFVNDMLLYPSLGEPVDNALGEVGFFFTVYAGAASSEPPEAVLELVQNGELLAQVPMELSEPDQTGRIQQVGRLPVGSMPPGTYELRVVVAQGADRLFRSTMFQLTE